MSQTTTSKQRKNVSVDFENLAVPKGRASSVSAQTIVDENPDFAVRRAPVQRRGTHVALVKVSWWDVFKATIFGTKNLKRHLAATVEWAEVEGSHAEFFDEGENWYKLIVSAYKREGREFIPVRCVLDTGCSQGNIISTKLAQRLGFSDSDYLPLTPREENGGMVATGHTHKVLGCIRVSWFSETSPKVFNNMRFLVSETADVDLVIGTRSIQKEKLLNPPNLMNEQKIHGLAKPSDKKRESLVHDIRTLEADKKKAEKGLEDTKEGTKEHAYAEKTLKKAKNALKIANWKLEIHDVGLDLKKNNSEKTQRALIDKKKGLEAKVGGKEKKEK
ncbi:hypothetical protein DPSP01_002874 [Paraphaeosphaeria sporulosa]|uniref:Uncharacterized protein n=1 Tax=Paraphaeosphaeria sporulosa TaxID=1460663 RepID=A0A177CHZ1_9PLEO|nr:uncharacterized protein CC84DRAFT_1176469 [Paraphaeosphaeria sporulosa]OAG06478.1 hypothetical protein CC84DRAFT_1176469 [Paraphaeosphaeria sporulosa]